MSIQRLIEDAARTSDEIDPRNPPNQMFQASIAISLKRIADRLDHMTDYFEPDKAQLRVGANCDVRPA